MPSSSEAVATSALSSPALSRSSARSRCSFARLPWCDVTASSPSRSARCARGALREPARVDEHERRAVRADQLREPVVLLDPDLVRHDRLERRCGSSSARSRLRTWPSSMTRAAPVRRAGEERGRARRSASCVAEMPTRVRRRRAQRLEPLERQREMRAALVARDRVDFVDDHRAHRRAASRGPTPP